ncbi:hypothetical protein GGD65_005398 [Bradyrhizobium sp. CIR18]|uniref:hypothetical protein n=1 Tax=Bradyrhizobium sp. CIR18 TaxID=2663839 RepID=UPI001605C972|nr:hypothetical protein [Bradyrhizobium sp. CIR18]MBB4364340.1 hypothetical protein [Bradyrhizobium sp. CIR18]
MARSGASALPNNIAAELRAAGDRSKTVTREQKKNYAELLSRRLAQRFADALRSAFPDILPDSSGKGQESKARSSKGFKKLDVNYSTVELGLGLGVSIKTINFRDATTKRYTKNYTRADGELRAEASDYHERQPYAVMVAVIFLPLDACDDGGKNAPSSFGQAVQVFRFRTGRENPKDPAMLFERVFVGLYDADEKHFGEVTFFDVMSKPPRTGKPATMLSFPQLVQEIVETYDRRNSPRFEWEDAAPEKVTAPPVEEDEEED